MTAPDTPKPEDITPPGPAGMGAALLDEDVYQTGRSGYRLTRVHRAGSYTLRIDVRCNADPASSTATIEVLTPHLTWTPVIDVPVWAWHDRWGADTSAMDSLADQLLQRTLRILPPSGAAPPT